jgi:hypothetical protein
MPSLHSPVVSTIVPSASRIASSKNAWAVAADLQADRVEDRLQTKNCGRVEAAAIVAGGGRIGNTPSAQGVEVRLVAAEQFQMLQTRSAGQQVVAMFNTWSESWLGKWIFNRPRPALIA